MLCLFSKVQVVCVRKNFLFNLLPVLLTIVEAETPIITGYKLIFTYGVARLCKSYRGTVGPFCKELKEIGYLS